MFFEFLMQSIPCHYAPIFPCSIRDAIRARSSVLTNLKPTTGASPTRGKTLLQSHPTSLLYKASKDFPLWPFLCFLAKMGLHAMARALLMVAGSLCKPGALPRAPLCDWLMAIEDNAKYGARDRKNASFSSSMCILSLYLGAPLPLVLDMSL